MTRRGREIKKERKKKGKSACGCSRCQSVRGEPGELMGGSSRLGQPLHCGQMAPGCLGRHWPQFWGVPKAKVSPLVPRVTAQRLAQQQVLNIYLHICIFAFLNSNHVPDILHILKPDIKALCIYSVFSSSRRTNCPMSAVCH